MVKLADIEYEVTQKFIQLEIACSGYKASTLEGNARFADFFWAVIKQLEQELGIGGDNGVSQTDTGKTLDTRNTGDAGWSWGEP